MGALGQRVPAHIRALDKTLIGDDCWEYGGKIRTDGYGSVFVHNGTRAGGGNKAIVWTQTGLGTPLLSSAGAFQLTLTYEAA
jgi:hypothetical protein